MDTIVLKVDPEDPNPSDIEQGFVALEAGKIVAFPTDTVYGIGADVFNEKAVRQIFTVKKREPDKPLQILIASEGDLQNIARTQSRTLRRLAAQFWPGPLTLVMLARENFPHWVRCGRNTVGVRMPANAVALKLIEAFGSPIAATSANISGFPDPISAEGVMKYLGGRIDLILDGGTTPSNVPSTVLDLSVWPPVILRQGSLSAEDLKTVLSSCDRK